MKTGGTMNFLRAILMTVLLMVIMAMTNSPPAKDSASVNSGLNSSKEVTTLCAKVTTLCAYGTYVANAIATNSYSSSMAIDTPLHVAFVVKMGENSTVILIEKTVGVKIKENLAICLSTIQTAPVMSSVVISSLNRATTPEGTDAKKDFITFCSSVTAVQMNNKG